MEPSNPETQTKVQHPQNKPDPKDSGQQPNGDANAADLLMGSASQGPAEKSIERNGDANAAGLVKGSASQGPTEQPMQRTESSGDSIKKSVHWNPELVTESTFVSSPDESPRHLSSSSMSSPSFSVKDTVETVRNVLGIWGRRVGEATKKAEHLAGNTWQHLRTNQSFAEAALGRIARGTKVLAEGGDDKIFRQTFETVPEEQLQKSYACYLSTSAGPVMGILYLSTAKIAYCSDNPLSFITDEHTEWSYYKVTVPLNELKAVNCSSSIVNPAEKYIQVTSVDNNEFWFMGFLNYEGAVECLVEAFQANKLPSEQ